MIIMRLVTIQLQRKKSKKNRGTRKEQRTPDRSKALIFHLKRRRGASTSRIHYEYGTERGKRAQAYSPYLIEGRRLSAPRRSGGAVMNNKPVEQGALRNSPKCVTEEKA